MRRIPLTMKYILPVILLILSLDTYSQDLVVIDTARIKCSYVYQEVKDTIKNDKCDDLIYLQIGSRCSKSYSYYTFRFDSLVSSPKGMKELNRLIAVMNSNWTDRSKLPPNDPFYRMSARVCKNYPQGAMTVTDFIIADHYLYEEDLNIQEWIMTEDSTKTVLGHECQMATCRFRGRDWTAWFALDIPINDGPWKFCGLPGLIMEVYDRNKQQYFCINGMQEVAPEPICFGTIGVKAKCFEKTTHSAFLKARYDNLRGDDRHVQEQLGIPPSEHKYVPRFDYIER